MSIPPVGKALRDARIRCGLTQAQAGAQTGYSASAISRIELGARIEITTLLRLANCYDITLNELGLGSVGDVPSKDMPSQDVLRSQFLILAGLTVPQWALAALDDALIVLPPTNGPVSGGDVTRRLAAGRALFDNDRHGQLVTALPDLLAAAHLHAEGTDLPSAWAICSSCYELATHTLAKLGRPSCLMAADRATASARRTESPVVLALSAHVLSIVLRQNNRAALAQRVILDAINAIQKTGLANPDERILFVQMLCSAAYAAAQAGERDRALELTAEADRAMRLLPARPDRPATPVNATVLTPAQVQLYKVSMQCELGNSAAALNAAQGVDRLPVPDHRTPRPDVHRYRSCLVAARAPRQGSPGTHRGLSASTWRSGRPALHPRTRGRPDQPARASG
ncbi:helix-turn-helix domain-containing protein [Actinocrispum wychmicini]|uniref:Helix-turn-helix protein n=1 Tax=Actinocrispum wychmicini TaxID=1213861 RepID=A0A4R2J8R4_9PSEU|nr:helix-turn-helix transcriptional regulator [Actinocrispum wychmicini]TCO55691.1 helix-turn-helix protein [Actinocrispum wychmicini]